MYQFLSTICQVAKEYYRNTISYLVGDDDQNNKSPVTKEFDRIVKGTWRVSTIAVFLFGNAIDILSGIFTFQSFCEGCCILYLMIEPVRFFSTICLITLCKSIFQKIVPPLSLVSTFSSPYGNMSTAKNR